MSHTLDAVFDATAKYLQFKGTDEQVSRALDQMDIRFYDTAEEAHSYVVEELGLCHYAVSPIARGQPMRILPPH